MNLKNVNHTFKLRTLGIPLSKALIVGSGTMALFGIKENDDLDLWVTDDVYRQLKHHKALVPIEHYGRVFYKTKDGAVEMSNEMPCTKGPLKQYLKRAIILYGYHFMSIDDVISWKKCMGRPKDLAHIKLIEKYKKRGIVNNFLKTIQTLK